MARTREEAAARRPEFEQWLNAEDVGRDAETLIDPSASSPEGLLGAIRALQQNGYDLLRGMSAAGSSLLDLASRT